MHINLIWAEAHNRVIGLKGVMPWHLPEDLAHLKRTTLGATVIMGRKTWESIPPKFRPLPGRTNIIVSRQNDFLASHAGSAVRAAASLEAALDMASQKGDVWIIGGAQIYAQALPLANKIIVTKIDAEFAGDAFAPALDSTWTLAKREDHTAANGLRYAFITYLRN
ncbi:MAG: dihydrofolate reductase [Cytophagales bacterium]|nr:dihydrofolate reductase [Cytophagales bacterium]